MRHAIFIFRRCLLRSPFASHFLSLPPLMTSAAAAFRWLFQGMLIDIFAIFHYAILFCFSLIFFLLFSSFDYDDVIRFLLAAGAAFADAA